MQPTKINLMSELQVSAITKKKTIYKILHKYLLIKPYKLQLFQTMKSEDIVIQHKFCRQILGRMKNDNLPTSFISNKEKTFHSKMNQHNSCIWGTQTLCHHSPAKRDPQKEYVIPDTSKEKVYGTSIL